MTPTNPQWVQDAVQGHTQRINDFAAINPQSLVAGPNANQTKAWDVMGAYKPTGPNLASRISLGGPASYSAPQLGDANTYDAPEIAALMEARAQQGSQYMQDYLNPYTDQVVNTSLASADENAGRVRAALAAKGAANNAFGGSRFALAEAATEADLYRERAGLEAGLRSNAFNTAAGLGMADADRFTQTNMFNAGQGNQRNIAQAGLTADASRFGADARNQFALGQANLDSQAGMFNAGAQNQFALSQAQMDQQGNMFNAGQMDQAQQRELASIGMLGDMGNQQWQIEQAQAQAPLQQMQALAGMHAANPYALFSGRDITGSSTGTSTTTSKKSVMDILTEMGSRAASAYAGGMG